MNEQDSISKERLDLVFSQAYGRKEREDIASVLRSDFEVNVLTQRPSRDMYEVIVAMFVFFGVTGIGTFLHSFMGEMGKILVHKIFTPAGQKAPNRVTVLIETKKPKRTEEIQAESEEELYQKIKRSVMELQRER